MKDNVVAIPSYINDIYLDYNEDWNQNKIGIGSTLPKLNSFENEDQKDFYMKKNLEKAIRMSIGGYATYSSSIKSTVIPIDFKIT